jgi:hypothetical protein
MISKLKTTIIQKSLFSKSKSLVFATVFILVPLAYKICLSARYGKLSGELTYDDISYFSSGMRYVALFKSSHLDFFNYFYTEPPSSLFFATLSFFTQYFFNNNPTLIYFCSGLIISLLVLCLAQVVFKRFIHSVLATSIFILSPFSSFYLMNYRPDTFFSLIFAIIIAMVTLNFKKYFYWIPALIWALFFSKPHFAVFIGLLLTYILFKVIKYDYLHLIFSRSYFKTFSLISTISIFLYWNGFKETITYIYANTYGNQVSWWKGSESIASVLISNLFNFAENSGGVAFCLLALLYVLLGLKLNNEIFRSKEIYAPLFLLFAGSFLIATFGGTPSAFFFLPCSSITLFLVFLSTKNIQDVFAKKARIPFLYFSIIGILMLRGLFPVTEWGTTSMKLVGNTNASLSRFVDNNSTGQTLVAFIGPVNVDALNFYSHHTLWNPPQQNYQFSFLQSGSEADINNYVGTMSRYNNILFVDGYYNNLTNMYVPNNRYQKTIETTMLKFYGEENFKKLSYGPFTLFQRSVQ